MGMFEQGLKKTGGQFLKTESGGKYRLRILDMPTVSAFRNNGNSSYRFNWPVWSYDDEAIKILTKGRSVLTQLDAISEEYGEKLPMDCDIVLTHKGSGFDTVYTLVPGKIKSELPENWQKDLPDMLTDPKHNIPYESWVKGSEPIPKESTSSNDEVPIEAYTEKGDEA